MIRSRKVENTIRACLRRIFWFTELPDYIFCIFPMPKLRIHGTFEIYDENGHMLQQCINDSTSLNEPHIFTCKIVSDAKIAIITEAHASEHKIKRVIKLAKQLNINVIFANLNEK